MGIWSTCLVSMFPVLRANRRVRARCFGPLPLLWASSMIKVDLLMVRSPGRWFVAQQLKLLLAYVALNYDIQQLEGRRPLNRVIGDSMVPRRDTVIKVRRRQAS